MVLLGDQLGAAVAPELDEQGTRTRRRIDRNTMVLTTVCDPNGFYLIDAMPKGEKFSARYHIDNIPTPICPRLIPASSHKLVIHADNSR
jgi:hypothetical protein